MKTLRRLRRIGRTIAVPLVVAVLTFALTGFAFTPKPTPTPRFLLTAGTDFSVTSTITAWPACSGAAVNLYPGVTDCLTYTVSNPLNVAITVTSLSASVSGASLPVGCPASLLDLSTASFSGTPTLTVAAGQSGSVPEQVSMQDNGNQDGCEAVNFTLDLSGTAQYSDSTTTALVSSANPSNLGSSVTFTATVSASNPTIDTSSPSGTVNFYSCPTAACATTTLLGSGAVNVSNGEATYSTSSLPSGTTNVEAIYQGSGTDFTLSTSNVVAQQVNAPVIGGGGGLPPLLPPPLAPIGAILSAIGQGNCSTGNVVASIGGITVTGDCDGALTLATYASDPVGAIALTGGVFFDVKVATGSAFSTLTLTDTSLNGATTLEWWNGTAWVAVAPQSFSAGPPASITAVLSGTSSPTIADLTGTVFAIGTPTTATAASGGTATTTTAASGGTTTTTKTTKSASPATKSGGSGSSELPFTGTNAIRLVLSGLAALLTGFALMGVSRRRTRHSETRP